MAENEEEIKTGGTLYLKTILDEFITKPKDVQIPGIVNIIVDEYLEFGISPNWRHSEKYLRYASRGLGYLLHNVPKSVLNRCLVGTCRGGHKELAELIVRRGANDWVRGLNAACKGGHPELVEFLIEKSSDDLTVTLRYDENNILRKVFYIEKNKRKK